MNVARVYTVLTIKQVFDDMATLGKGKKLHYWTI